MFWKQRFRYGLGIAALALLTVPCASAQISLSSTVDLALQNSTQVKIATADMKRAIAGVAEAKDVYLPNLVAGSSPGPPSIGFPLGQPSVFNVTSQSLVYSFSQSDYIRSARAALNSAQLNLRDNRDQVTLDTALAYLQLDDDTLELASLNEEKADVEKLVDIERERLIAGVDGRMELTKAQITSAQVDIKRLQLEDDADQQRDKLAHLTGLPPASFITDPKSIPLPPDFDDSNNDSLVAQARNSNAGVQAAYANAKSKLELSFGDEKQNYRPQFAFGAEYSRFAAFNNYSEYYLHFQNNNFGAAVQITLPLFDASRRAKARESAAEALRANAEADQAKDQTSEQVKTLQRSLAELKAQQRIAQLQSEYAQEQLETVQSELKNGSGSPNAAPVTPKDEQLARIELQQRHTDVLNANLSLMRAQLSLMRSLGEIDGWVHSGVK